MVSSWRDVSGKWASSSSSAYHLSTHIFKCLRSVLRKLTRPHASYIKVSNQCEIQQSKPPWCHSGEADGRGGAAVENRHPGHQGPERAAGVSHPRTGGNIRRVAGTLPPDCHSVSWLDPPSLPRRGSDAHLPSTSSNSISQKASVHCRSTARLKGSLWVVCVCVFLCVLYKYICYISK